MKLLRLKLLTDFRGLQKGFEIKFSPNTKTDKIDPICFVGPNGGGKSNVLELLSEIFYYLDFNNLEYSGRKKEQIRNFGFELEYKIKSPYKDDYDQVKITKAPEGGNARFHIRKNDKYVKEKSKKIRKLLLPKRIIGYSSGMNELISNPFIKMQYHYFNEYERKVKYEIYDRIEDSRLVYMDYNSNSAIMIANFLLSNDQNLRILCDHLNFTGLISFRIKIRFKDHKGKTIELTPELKNQIEFLKNCATCFNDETKSKENLLTLDYFVTEETKKAFRRYFKTSYQIVRVFYLLNQLNIHLINPKKRTDIRNADRDANISAQIPKPPPEQLIFRLGQVRLKKKGVQNPIPYKSISDGEHQFMHVVGMVMMMEEDEILFLLDEPETHFNPEWRSKLVNTLNKITGSRESRRKEQEFIITTHSPFILSDCHQHNVFIFERNPKSNKVEKRQLDIQTYGASSDVLLTEVFNQENTISDMANADIKELMKAEIKSLEDIEKIKRKARRLGESAEKFMLISELNRKKRELEK